jgi:hypothetical protein
MGDGRDGCERCGERERFTGVMVRWILLGVDGMGREMRSTSGMTRRGPSSEFGWVSLVESLWMLWSLVNLVGCGDGRAGFVGVGWYKREWDGESGVERMFVGASASDSSLLSVR